VIPIWMTGGVRGVHETTPSSELPFNYIAIRERRRNEVSVEQSLTPALGLSIVVQHRYLYGEGAGECHHRLHQRK